MKVSWRNISDPGDKYPREHTFVAGQLHEGKNPHEFIMHLIRMTSAVAVALDGKSIWKASEDLMSDAEKVATRALMGEPRQAQLVISIDYNTQGDWIDNECKPCGFMHGTHAHDCSMMAAIDKEWQCL